MPNQKDHLTPQSTGKLLRDIKIAMGMNPLEEPILENKKEKTEDLSISIKMELDSMEQLDLLLQARNVMLNYQKNFEKSDCQYAYYIGTYLYHKSIYFPNGQVDDEKILDKKLKA